MKKEQKSASQLGVKREASKQKVDNLRATLVDLSFNESEFNALEQEKDQLSSSVAELTDVVDTLSAQIQSRLAFRYSDPVRGFDRSKVKGLIAKLIHVKASEHATALEVVAGGKLYQVVVDEAITGKALLDRGKLERRVTIIPLDKIQPRSVTNAACGEATKIAKSMDSSAWPAIELVGFDEEVRSAIEYVFGSSIVVDGAKAANKICDATKTRTVTLDGDVYDPSGTISGGSKNNLGTTLAKLSELSDASEKLAELQSRLESVKARLGSLKEKCVQYEKFSAKLELAEAELAAIEKHLSQTSYGVLVEKFESMSKELEDSTTLHVEMQKEKDEKWDLYHELKDREIELTQDRETRLGQIEDAVKDAKKSFVEKAKRAREVSHQFATNACLLPSILFFVSLLSLLDSQIGRIAITNAVAGA
jgi:structural maintenance of chromosome 2